MVLMPFRRSAAIKKGSKLTGIDTLAIKVSLVQVNSAKFDVCKVVGYLLKMLFHQAGACRTDSSNLRRA